MDRPIVFQRAFRDWAGSTNAALMLSQLVYWTNRTKNPHGWVYKTMDEWQDEIGLTRDEQFAARKRLRERGLVEETRRGLPARLYFRVTERLKELINSSCRKIRHLEVGTSANLTSDLPTSNSYITTYTTKQTILTGASARGREKDFGLNGKDGHPTEEALQLTRLYYQLLTKERLHIGRADLPRGDSEHSKKRRRKTFRAWATACDHLIERHEDPANIEKVMVWYFNNHKREFVPSGGYALTTFANIETYAKIAKAMRRDLGEVTESGGKITGVVEQADEDEEIPDR